MAEKKYPLKRSQKAAVGLFVAIAAFYVVAAVSLFAAGNPLAAVIFAVAAPVWLWIAHTWVGTYRTHNEIEAWRARWQVNR